MGSSTRRIARLTLDNLDDLPTACRRCVFWELDPVARERAVASGHAADEKESWVSRVLLEWGSCGRILYVDDQPAGYALYAPAAYVPGATAFPTSPASEDAVLLAALAVRREYAGGGLGRVLVQAVVKDVVQRGGIRAIEAFGDRRPPSGGPSCVIPADFLLRVGFKTHRRHGRYPRLRMEMRSVLTWREEVEQALEKLLQVVRPRPVTSPSPAERVRPRPRSRS
ncbi:MAG: GNAT family N-acetyltransferase [Actinomycetes bacterium]|nr:GNAT family N-acetyltransferase [Actinomycetes bacterium]MDX5380759.1 GNAT family N-acetyltransferase [Actinomycetes bacterium]MDX5399765.1 GNAT family N-acetyltransferase [Actinomycetes bacterium]MDX5450499.1 GNAT family N-acetyltransferase [Actinomycetes bacterium]